MVLPLLAFGWDSQSLTVIAGVGVALLGVVYFAVRFWLVSTRPPAIGDVHTPNLDRLNQEALEQMADPTSPDDREETKSDEDAPEALRRVISHPKA